MSTRIKGDHCATGANVNTIRAAPNAHSRPGIRPSREPTARKIKTPMVMAEPSVETTETRRPAARYSMPRALADNPESKWKTGG